MSNRCIGWVVLAALATGGSPLVGQGVPAAMPSWLSPVSGAAESIQKTAAGMQSAYQAAMEPDRVVAHYKAQFEKAGVALQARGDGIGTVLKARAPECDLLIQVRESQGGSSVRVHCTTPAPAPAATATLPSVGGASYAGARSSDADREWREKNDQFRQDQTRQMAEYDQPVSRSEANARFEARRAEAIAKMQAAKAEMAARFGATPVPSAYPPVARTPIPRPAGMASADFPQTQPGVAPPLEWPHWLVHEASADRACKPVEEVEYGKKYLVSRFVTRTPMSALHQFYEELLENNGFRVYNSRLSTGQTIAGTVQNASGHVEGSYSPNGMGKGKITVNVSYWRKVLNGPIDVKLRVGVSDRY